MSLPNLRALLSLWRPHQWLKNGFVWVGVIFAHRWDAATLGQVGLVFAAFCCAASATYVFNDLRDRESDRLHRSKRFRPLAAGTVGTTEAVVSGVLLALVGLALAWWAGGLALPIVVGYGVLNVLYTLWLKRVVILDVFVISAGFMLRILAGTTGVDIEPSSWLLLCGLMFTLFLGFCKRRAELAYGQVPPAPAREVLAAYDVALLAQFQSITATCTLVSYALYTVNAETVKIHGTEHLIYTVPVIAFGLFRYLLITQTQEGAGEDTSRDLFRDRPLLLSVLGWVGLTVWLLQ